MAIGTQFSARLTKVTASYPNSLASDAFVPVQLFTSSFSKEKASRVEAKLYIQGLPSTRFVTVDALLWTYQIEFPILIGTSGVRTDELIFWQQWMRYWRAAKDSPASITGIPSSAVVTKASLKADVDQVAMSLQIVSNFDLGWYSEFSYADTAAYRGAYSPDLMAEIRAYGDDGSTVPTNWGWKDKYMISSINGEFSSDHEMINMSQNASSVPLAYAHIPDMLVVKGIKASGNMEIFGTRTDPLVTSSQIAGYFVVANADPLFGGDSTGGIQIWVANRDEADNLAKPVILELPTGLMVGNSRITGAAGDVIKVQKEFVALYTDYEYADT